MSRSSRNYLNTPGVAHEMRIGFWLDYRFIKIVWIGHSTRSLLCFDGSVLLARHMLRDGVHCNIGEPTWLIAVAKRCRIGHNLAEG